MRRSFRVRYLIGIRVPGFHPARTAVRNYTLGYDMKSAVGPRSYNYATVFGLCPAARLVSSVLRLHESKHTEV